jgi:aryl-alcohol dehydrogenase-like predicted oxidoreductase
MAPARRVGRPESIREEAELSLKRLRTDRIDLYQMHWPPEDGTPIEEYWGTLLELRQEGVIAAAGLSNHSAEQVQAAERLGHVDSVQPPLSLINRQAAADLIPWCRDHETGVIVYSPMQSGLLTGAFTAERVAGLPEDDWRRRSGEFTVNLERNLALAEALRPVAERHGLTQAAIAVAWTLVWPGVTGAIVGARRPDQVDSWLPAADLELTDEDLDELAAAIEATGAGSGPVRPTSGA